MARLIDGFEQFFDGSGDPLVSGLIDFFESGSASVRKTTYADVEETIANPNPVVLNGDGRCPNVFGTGTYRAILRTAAGTQILQRDPIGGDQNLTFGADWSSTQSYAVSDVVRENGEYWISQTSGNLDNRPSTDGGVNWVRFFDGLVKSFDTLALLQADTTIAVGDRVTINGRFAAGDGGQNDYKIVEAGTGTPDNGSYIDLSGSGLQAKAIFRGGIVNARQFGAVGDGVTDDTTAFQAAIDYIGEGGTVNYSGKHLIDTALTINNNVSLVGPYAFVGSPDTNTSAPYGALNSALIVNSTVTITLKGSAGVYGSLIYRKGMTFPAANSSAYAGTAFTCGGDDAFILNSMILGFSKAYYSNNWQRPRVQNVNIDCLNGVELNSCYDISHIRNVHCWPFATIASAGPSTSLERAGSAFKFTNVGDWNKITDCFSYGYHRGFHVDAANSITFLGCSADGTGSYAGSLGFYIINGSTDTRIIGCQAAGQETGVYVNTTANVNTSIVASDFWGNANHSVLVEGGDVNINGGTNRTSEYGVTITDANSVVNIDNVRFEALTLGVINATVATSNVFIGKSNYYDGVAAGGIIANANVQTQSIASAEPLNLPANGDTFVVTGTTSFSTLNGGWDGREVFLQFAGALTVTDGASMNLQGNFVTTANDTLVLRHVNGSWVEGSRSVN